MAEINNCVFCQIASKAIPANVVYEDAAVICVLDISPATSGHTIALTKNHYNSVYEIPQPEYLHLLSISRAVGYALLISQGATNIDMVCTQELRKGNFTPHSIIHLIPRYQEDTVNYVWQPKTMSQDELQSLSAAIISAIEKVKTEGGVPVSYEAPAAPSKPQPAQQPLPQPKKEEKKPVELSKKTVVF